VGHIAHIALNDRIEVLACPHDTTLGRDSGNGLRVTTTQHAFNQIMAQCRLIHLE
jgi:hypothetical protein